MAYSIHTTQEDCYPGTTVLINKLDLQNQDALDQAERISVTLRAAELEARAFIGPFTFQFYCDLHKTLFADLYDWAGKLRTIDISKKGTRFYPSAELQKYGEAKFQYLASENEFRDLPLPLFVEKISEFYHELNMLHPFREGNGRTQRLFFTLLIRRAGYCIDFADCEMDKLMMATIYAAQGVQTYLTEFFQNAIHESSAHPQANG